jgi:short subunit dehydrogenase-like uncharacterized protein
MAGRIVPYGATGYIGGLTARAMITSGARPVLAGRNRARVEALAARLSPAAGGAELETAVAGTDGPAAGKPYASRDSAPSSSSAATTPAARYHLRKPGPAR